VTTPAYMTPAEFAERIGMKEGWVRSHLDTIPHRRVGRFLRFTEDDLAAFVAKTAETHDIERTSRSRTAVERRTGAKAGAR